MAIKLEGGGQGLNGLTNRRGFFFAASHTSLSEIPNRVGVHWKTVGNCEIRCTLT